MIAVIKTGRHITERIPAAFAEGCGGDLLSAHQFLSDPKKYNLVVCYGILRGPRRALQYAIRRKVDFVHIDHAYFNSARGYKGNPEGWNFRVTKNGFQSNGIKEWPDSRRHQIQGVRLLKYRSDDPSKMVMVCPPSAAMLAFFPDARAWLPRIRRRLKNAKIKFMERHKKLTKKQPPISWGDIRMLLTYNSSLGLEAMTKGIPFYTEAAGKELRTEPERIHNQKKGDRAALMTHLSWSQFSLEEMRLGKVLEYL